VGGCSPPASRTSTRSSSTRAPASWLGSVMAIRSCRPVIESPGNGPGPRWQLRVIGARASKSARTASTTRAAGARPRVVPGGSRVQGCDERLSLLLIGALGKQLLELVDHHQQPLRLLRRRPIRIPCWQAWPRQGAWRAVRANPAGSASSPRRTAPASALCQGCHPHGQLVQRRMSRVNSRHGRTPTRVRDATLPRAAAAAPSPQQRGFAAPRHAPTPPAAPPRPGAETSAPYLPWRPFRAKEERRVPFLECAQAPVRRINHSRDGGQRWRGDPSVHVQPVVAVDDLVLPSPTCTPGPREHRAEYIRPCTPTGPTTPRDTRRPHRLPQTGTAPAPGSGSALTRQLLTVVNAGLSGTHLPAVPGRLFPRSDR